jgi:hypothetical protein
MITHVLGPRTRDGLHAELRRVMADGPVTGRQLFDIIYTARFYHGPDTVTRWVLELAVPDYDPPGPNTLWRLRGDA